jgi:hypothetical protein
MSRWIRFRTQAASAWEVFKSWHRPLPTTPERWAEHMAARQRAMSIAKRLATMTPREHAIVWRDALRLYAGSWSVPTTAAPRTNASDEIDGLIAAHQRASAEQLRAAAGRNAVSGAKGMAQLAPTAAVWAREQLFLLRLSVRSFLSGYAEGKAEAESRDWFRIQRQIFADAGDSQHDADAPPAKVAPQAPPPTTTVAAAPTATSNSLKGVEFVRRPRKPVS